MQTQRQGQGRRHMPDPIVEARIRARSFWYRDGLIDIVIGIASLLQNGFSLVIHFGNHESRWYWPVILTYLLLFFAFSARAPRIMAAVRERIAYPRTGYAEPGESRRTLGNTIVVLSIIAIFALLLATRYGHFDTGRWIQEMPVVGGLLYVVVGMYVAIHYGMLRYLLMGLFSIVLAVAINIECPSWLGTEIWLMGVSCAFLFAGGITVWNFVRTTPLSADPK